MMCSSWKISVFGIVAFMLAFGLLTTDATAQTDYSPVRITVGGADTLRAAGKVAETAPITFEVNSSVTAATADPDGAITITIPSGWSRPFLSDAADTRPGAVSHNIPTAAGTGDAPTIEVNSGKLIVKVKRM